MGYYIFVLLPLNSEFVSLVNVPVTLEPGTVITSKFSSVVKALFSVLFSLAVSCWIVTPSTLRAYRYRNPYSDNEAPSLNVTLDIL